MGGTDWLIASNIRSATDAMCTALATVGKKVKSGEIETSSQVEMMAWAFSIARPDWDECGENTFCRSAGGKIEIRPDDDIKTLTLKVVRIEQGPDELAANGFTEEKLVKMIDDEVKDFMRR